MYKNTLLAARGGCKCTHLTPLNPPLKIPTLFAFCINPSLEQRTVLMLPYECSALQALRWMYIIRASRFFVGHHPPSVYNLTTYDQISQAFPLHICILTAKRSKTGGGNGLGMRLH